MEPDGPEHPGGPRRPRPEPVPYWRWRLRRQLAWMRRHARAVAIAAVIGAIGAIVAIRLLAEDEGVATEERLPASISQQVRKIVRGMPPAEKVDQILVAGLGAPSSAAGLNPEQLGGVLVSSEAWSAGGPELLADLRAAGDDGIPPLIVADQEGGEYRAYSDLPPAERQLDIGDAASAEGAEAWARDAGTALRKAGFDMNLAPIADVASLASPVADRAFGDDPELVAELTAATVRGCEAAEIICAVAHFPGLGGASADTDLGPATVSLDSDSIETRDLVPFKAAFDAEVPAVVISNAFYAAYDPVTPASLSSAVVTDLLRDELDYEGVAVTDDLSAGAIAAGTGAPSAAVEALAAGEDLVVVGDPAGAQLAREEITRAVEAGDIPAGRLTHAAARVIEMKRRAGLLQTK